MPLPEHTRALLYAAGTWHLPGDPEAVCEGSRFHSPTPMFVAEVPLIPASWGEEHSVASRRLRLCGTCRDNLAILRQIFVSTRGQVPWEVRREFGNTIRALAEEAWSKRTEGLSHG
jgi:hypothetical protein